MRQTAIAICVLLAVALPSTADALQDRYDYDPLGRLIRWIAPDGAITEYVYDAAGNILEVRSNVASEPPVVNGYNPSFIRRNSAITVVVNGRGFQGVALSTSSPDVALSAVQVQATSISFTASARSTAALGTVSIGIANSLGRTTVPLVVRQALPSLSIAPTPISVTNNSVAGDFTLILSNDDFIAHGISLSVDDSTVATVSPAASTIPVGGTSLPLRIAGLKAGVARVSVSSPTLGNTTFSVFVSAPVPGIFQPRSGAVSVMLLGPGEPPPPPLPVSPVASGAVGVVVQGEPSDPAAPRTVGPVASSTVGVLVTEIDTPSPVTTSAPLQSPPVSALLAEDVSPKAPQPVSPILSAPVGVVWP